MNSRNSGFALIASLSIMSILVLIAVALYSLSSVATKSADIAAAKTEAEANARMALMMAVGNLQKYTGSDTRITAPANIISDITLDDVDDAIPKLTGAWRSWEGLNHDNTGRPVAEISGTPIYDLKELANDSSNPADPRRFLTWLVSSASEGQNIDSPESLAFLTASTVGGINTIPLLSAGDSAIATDGSLSDSDNDGNPREIHVVPSEADGGGRYAWWVSPENQKASVIQNYEPRSNDPSALVEKWQGNAIPNLEEFGLQSLMDEPENFSYNGNNPGTARKALNLATTKFIADSDSDFPNLRFHDLSTSAVGLLTNTATGGWRKDLSILSEKWDDIYAAYPAGQLPLFRFSPQQGDTSLVVKPTLSDTTPDQSTLYPWSTYSQFSPRRWPNTLHAASSSWESLINFATLYKDFSFGEGAAESPFIWSPVMKWRWQGNENDATDQEFFDYNHIPRVHPVIARFQFIIYVRAFPDPNPARVDRYGFEMLWSPVVTLWNPYNVRLSIDNPGPPNYGIVIGGKRSIPAAFAARPRAWDPTPADIPPDQYRLLAQGNMQYMDTNGNFGGGNHDSDLTENQGYGNRWKDMRSWGVNLPNGTLTFEPGEVRMFSANNNSSGAFAGSAYFGTNNGYQPGAPSGVTVPIRSGNTPPEDFYWFDLKNNVYTKPFHYRSAGRGFHIAFGMETGTTYIGAANYTGVGQEMMSSTALANGSLADEYWPEDDLVPHGYTVGEIASVPAMPLYSITIGPRTTIGTGAGASQNRPTKGFLQSDPLAGMSLADPGGGGPNSHPANGNFEMSYQTLALGSTLTPNLSDREGFIVTGVQSGDGLSRLITHELPLRPMASLVELQAWNPRGKNPMPPYQSNLIGNSDATPIIPPNDIVREEMNPDNVAENLQHDDAYCANHLLFDDFFLSSIAPQPADFGDIIAREIETVYSDFLEGDEPLTNRAYKPISDDSGLSESDASQVVADIVNSPGGDGWLKVASRLEVNGMFNVNSTSVEAWIALLSHAKGMSELAIYEASGIGTVNPSSSIGTVDPSADHPVTRGVIASDVEAGSDPALADAAELSGFRGLDYAQIQDLAEKIVEQVRLRGPFLSLSEFVNRQLSNNEDLALAGAVQSAINNLDDDPMSVIRDSGNFLADDTMASKAAGGSSTDDDFLDGVDYDFALAAEGNSAYGMPGWIRQADVLRPIAPVLSARDDTFTIRAYGDVRDAAGDITARAWCEATVRRQRNYVDSTDAPDSINGPTSEINRTFGRKYEIVSFRWLESDEV